MNTSILLRRVALLLSSAVLLALSSCASGKPAPMGHTTHTITISYNAAATPQWSYTISPANNDAKNARVKRHDRIEWLCNNGAWTIYFKGRTPLADRSGKELPYVSGASGATAGGEVAEKVKKDDEYSYGVSVLLPGATNPVIDDPRIFIEN